MIQRHESKLYYIYALYSEDNPEEFRYVGITSRTIQERFLEHKYCANCDLQRSQPVHKWMYNKFQNNIKVLYTEIDYYSNIEWKTREIYWVNYYKKLNHRLLNLQKGGSGVVTLNMRNLSGIQRTIKAKELPVIAYDKDDNEVAKFDSIVKAAQWCNLDKSTVWGACGQRKTKTAGGYRWEYLPKEIVVYEKNTNPEYNKRIEIDQFDKNGHLIKHYLSVRQMRREFRHFPRNYSVFKNTYLDKDKLWFGFYWKTSSV